MREIKITPELTAQICEAIKEAGTLRMADHLKMLPCDRNTIDKLRQEDDEFHQTINKARAVGYEKLIDDTLVIAFDKTTDFLTLDDGKVIINHNSVQRAKLKIDTIFRRVSMANPARYSDSYYKASGRKIKCPGFAEAKTADEKYAVICSAVSAGTITLEMAASLSSLCEFQSKQEDITAIEARLAEVEKGKE